MPWKAASAYVAAYANIVTVFRTLVETKNEVRTLVGRDLKNKTMNVRIENRILKYQTSTRKIDS